MNNLSNYIDIFKLNVSSIHNVPESYSSEVYRIELENGETVILKIPFSKPKLRRELEILIRLEDKLPVPRVLNSWEGDDKCSGALLLSYIIGDPIVGEINEDLAFQMGELLGKLHRIPMEHYNLVEGETDDWWLGIRTIF